MNTESDPKIHQRKSIRLKGYDYSQTGGYYVTIVTFVARTIVWGGDKW
jgi:hypothetical protein